ncbi:sulfurtransferase complex subunit TusD [Alteromonas australica]|uniref:Sulfur transfer complex subunit TusD n=1 Tax=Alteromonas australica TaxID=589873 RepID=A0A075NZU5_9ALTE|nr:sulfurtransferase complex subunit TusD [Alteromonas australica]MAF69581.1 sulfurtransferase TusD [Alteromonas sp.]AIF99058.1 sulfur transfer complex subunit TusD [Alteromonas australica]MBU33497.1 sulfurtransferase TusD [Alteromonas sp.]HAI71565.1 sulfurtransferase complex subunit TusD [Alteromonas australica]HBU53067.1 sulfurtransferase complex subunit TusD [Alteromonas australica]|tara:strand:- start:575 stop:964 length:390 start_codon:yes stop_codon:yes gene_type:complete
MKAYSILITSSPYHGDCAQRALAFIDGLLANGDTLKHVFFYGDGVYHCNNMMLQSGNDFYVYGAWESLASTHNTQLLVCITAAVKRGIVSQQEAAENGISAVNLTAPFVQAGLGEFFSELHQCERLVQF